MPISSKHPKFVQFGVGPFTVRTGIQTVKDHAIHFCFAFVIVIINIAGAEITPHIGTCIAKDICAKVVTVPLIVSIMLTETMQIIMRYEPLCLVQKIVSGFVKGFNADARLKDVIDNQYLLARSIWSKHYSIPKVSDTGPPCLVIHSQTISTGTYAKTVSSSLLSVSSLYSAASGKVCEGNPTSTCVYGPLSSRGVQ